MNDSETNRRSDPALTGVLDERALRQIIRSLSPSRPPRFVGRPPPARTRPVDER